MPPLSDVIDGLPCALGECADGYVCELVDESLPCLPSQIGDSGSGGARVERVVGSSGGAGGRTGGGELEAEATLRRQWRQWRAWGSRGRRREGGSFGVRYRHRRSSTRASRRAPALAALAAAFRDACSSDAGSFCHDGILDHDETDVDCGGPVCAPCQLGQACLAAIDCASQVCGASDGGQRVCATPCADGFMDGTETDTDCGEIRLAPRAQTGVACLRRTRTARRATALRSVCAAATCFDQSATAPESDVGCGGTSSPACKLCVSWKALQQRPRTCFSVVLRAGVDLPPGADVLSDGVKNSSETDKDCGGEQRQRLLRSAS